MSETLSAEWQQVVADTICNAARLAYAALAEDAGRPHVLMRPRIFIDGNACCALYGENLQDGVAGFGASPQLAMADFDKNWWAALPGSAPTTEGGN